MNKATHRGTCQACGRVQAIRPDVGFVAKHGYTVDWGFFNGICAGADVTPMEYDTTLALSICAQLEVDARRNDVLASKLERGEIFPKWVKSVWQGYGKTERREVARETLTDFEASQQVLGATHRARSAAKSARAHITLLKKLMAERYQQPLYPIAPARRALAVGDKVSYQKGTVVCEVVELKHMRATGCGPYLNGHYVEHAILKRLEDGKTYPVPVRRIRASSVTFASEGENKVAK